MARKVFKSKIDWWFWLAIAAAVLGVVAAVVAVILEGRNPTGVTIVIFASLFAIAFFGSVAFGTSYTIDRKVLFVRSGPFRWKVVLDEITSVEATRNPLSSPALSLDRLRIRYGKRRSIMVSPADKAGFLKAIGQELTS